MAKKSKKLRTKRSKLAAKKSSALSEHGRQKKQSSSESKPTKLEEQSSAELGKQVFFALIDTELYGDIYAPVLKAYAERRDETALRQLIESIVSEIAMRDAYQKYRKIDDICQRYLYYVESKQAMLVDVKQATPAFSKTKKRELLDLETLCLYWREQVFYCLFRDAEAIYGLLLSEESKPYPPHIYLSEPVLISAARRILCPTIAALPREELKADAADLYAFLRGRSFPYLAYETSRIFAYVGRVGFAEPSQMAVKGMPEELEQVFALIKPDVLKNFVDCLYKGLEETLFLDLVAAQHSKLYAELCDVFEPDDVLPVELRKRLMQRARFDKAYREAFDKVLSARPLKKTLHRFSRLDIAELNALGKLYVMLKQALERQLSVFSFHLSD